ncbi:MAG: phosphoribosylanthranilate isomerase [Verrucomicrobium sp.]|nr:phosphoribosylanthranilate isomerase [Verrucomicrobium sp.]
MTRTKICGLTRPEDVRAALDAGADALGFILYPKSKRHVTPDQAAALLASVPPFVSTVAVLVDPSAEEVRGLAARLPFTHFQLHGKETPETVAALRPLKIIKALTLPADPALVKAYEAAGVEAFLLDTPAPEHGGTGRTFDWGLVPAFAAQTALPFFLSGGLTPDNVGAAIERVRPYGVDVASGVEASPGVKDHQKIARFIAACRLP